MAVTTVTPAASTPAAVTVPSAAPAPAIPRAYAKKHPVHEPIRSVKAVGRAGIGIVRVVAPLADRGTVFHGSGNKRRTNSNIFLDILGHCRYCERQSQQHRN
jgi:hypothetical protein